jgi:DNA-binding transcriptional LysR family regulator
VAVADSTQRGRGVTHNLLLGQDVLTVPSMQHKLQAQLRGLGVGFLPWPLAQPHIDAGRLLVKPIASGTRQVPVSYAWRRPAAKAPMGQALRWWLDRLEHPNTRHALLDRHDVG